MQLLWCIFHLFYKIYDVSTGICAEECFCSFTKKWNQHICIRRKLNHDILLVTKIWALDTELKWLIQSVTFCSGPPHLLIIHRFQRRQRSEAETIQQSDHLGLQDGQPSVAVTSGPSQLQTRPDWFSIYGPVTERWIHWAGGCDLQTLPIQEGWKRDVSSFIVGAIRFLSCWVRRLKPADPLIIFSTIHQEKSNNFLIILRFFPHVIFLFFPFECSVMFSVNFYTFRHFIWSHLCIILVHINSQFFFIFLLFNLYVFAESKLLIRLLKL